MRCSFSEKTCSQPFNRKTCMPGVVLTFLVLGAIGLLVAQLKGKIDMSKFGQTTPGKITYSVVGGSLAMIAIAAIYLSCKAKKTRPPSLKAEDRGVATNTSETVDVDGDDVDEEEVLDENSSAHTTGIPISQEDPRLDTGWVLFSQWTPLGQLDDSLPLRTTGISSNPLGENTLGNEDVLKYTVVQPSGYKTLVACRSNVTVKQLRECLAEQTKKSSQDIVFSVDKQELEDETLLNEIDWGQSSDRSILMRIILLRL